MKTNFVSEYDATLPDVTKWLGGCFVDASSGVGGFCLFENNESAYWDCQNIDATEAPDGTTVLLDYNDPYPDVLEWDYGAPVNLFWTRETSNLDSPDPSLWTIDSTTVFGVGTRTMEIYRFPASDITAFEGAWENTDLQCDKGNYDPQGDGDTTNDPAAATNNQDGRAYRLSLQNDTKTTKVTTGLEYFDYPACTVDDTAGEWTCLMFLPNAAAQTDGYPAFRQPGVIDMYFIHPYAPGVKQISYIKG